MNIIQKFKEFFTPSKVKELEEKVLQLEQKLPVLQKGTDLVEEIEKNKVEKIISKILYNTNTKNIDIILSNGNVLSGIVEKDIYEEITNCNDELMILDLISPTKEEIKGSDFDIEVEKIITPLINILSSNSNFEIENNKVYLKGIKSIAIPSSIVAEFIRIVSEMDKNREKEYGLEYISKDADLEEEYNSLLMFTRWLLLNPIESARQDCLTFVKKNDIKLTSNGLMQCYRRIVKRQDSTTNAELVQFISESYHKVKKNKKSPKNYCIGERVGDYKLLKVGEEPKDENPYWTNQGNLAELYANLHTLQQETYTDAHTKTKDIKIGAIYREDEDKIDLDNTKDCAAGIHCGSRNFGFSGFGDVGVLVLVNPMYVRSVPVSDAHKMRVSEMFICCTMEKEDYDNIESILDFSEEYSNATVEELTESLKNKSFNNLACQENYVPLSINDINKLTHLLKQRIVQV